MNLKKVQELSAEIENFRKCYEGNELWGRRDGPVDMDDFISFLIEHPEFQEIANKISKLSADLDRTPRQ
jgi:hypothetical protein